jgi:hypothetical protein
MKNGPFAIIHVLQGIFGIQYILFHSILLMYLISLTEHYETLGESFGCIITTFPTPVRSDVFNLEKIGVCPTHILTLNLYFRVNAVG